MYHLAKLECKQVAGLQWYLNIKNTKTGWGQWIWILKFTHSVAQKFHVSNGTGYSFNATPILWSETRRKHRICLIPTRLPSFCPFLSAGAFIPGVPVQPVLLRYPNEMVRITSSSTPKQGESLLSLIHIFTLWSCGLFVFSYKGFTFNFPSPIK